MYLRKYNCQIKQVNKMDEEELMNTEYSSHIAKNDCMMWEAETGRGKW